MLRARLISAAIALPLLMALLAWGSPGVIFFFFLLLVGGSVYEMASMFLPALERSIVGHDGPSVGRRWVWFCVAASMGLFTLSAAPYVKHGQSGAVVGFVLLLMVSTFSAKTLERSIVNMAGSVLCVAYGCLPWISLWDLYLMGPQARYLLLLLTIVFLCDTGAYFVGRAWGKRKLSPLSPKKTWEGVIGGILAACGGVFALDACFSFALGPWWMLLTTAILGGIAGIMGDLVESAFKRFSGVKDSGSVMPGHGGILDRVDALLFAAPVVWMVVSAQQMLTGLI